MAALPRTLHRQTPSGRISTTSERSSRMVTRPGTALSRAGSSLESGGPGIIARMNQPAFFVAHPILSSPKAKSRSAMSKPRTLAKISPRWKKASRHPGAEFCRYLDGLPNWVSTDYLEFRWYVSGEHRMTVRLAELDGKKKLQPLPDGEQDLANLLKAFLTQKSKTIGTAKDLAERMAGTTRLIRDLNIKT